MTLVREIPVSNQNECHFLNNPIYKKITQSRMCDPTKHNGIYNLDTIVRKQTLGSVGRTHKGCNTIIHSHKKWTLRIELWNHRIQILVYIQFIIHNILFALQFVILFTVQALSVIIILYSFDIFGAYNYVGIRHCPKTSSQILS